MNYKRVYYIFHPFEIVKEFIESILFFLQRGIRGYSDQDTWSFDYYLATVIHKGVKQIKDSRTGYPADPDMTEEKWDEILGKISDGFGKLLEFSDNPDLWNDEKLKSEIDEAKQLFVQYFDSLWD